MHGEWDIIVFLEILILQIRLEIYKTCVLHEDLISDIPKYGSRNYYKGYFVPGLFHL